MNERVHRIKYEFGEQTSITKLGDKYQTRVNVIVCEHFYGAILGLGDRIKIKSPVSAVQDLREYIKGIENAYE